MTGYLFDTNVISEVRKPRPHGAVVAWVAALNPRQIYVPAIALYELQAGVELTRRQDPEKAVEIENWIDSLSGLDQILPMDTECFRLCARFMHGKSGDLFADAMIAATASVYRLTVATRNTKDYRPFQVPVVNPFSNRASSASLA
jgi:predicted nucleic acid-binding protein